MQEKKPCDGKELICINVDKVYDWIVKEKSFDVSPKGAISFHGIPMDLVDEDLKGATVTCEVTPDRHKPIVILGREDRPFCIDGKNVCLQQLNIKKKFDLTIFVTLCNGSTFCSKPIDVSRCELVTLCAPEGTDVEVTYTNLDCFVCSTGKLEFKQPHMNGVAPAGGPPVDMHRKIKFSDLNVTVDTCQSIQSTFPVTVEFLADFCEPREDIVSACSPPMRPKQCPSVFPDDGHRHGHGHGHCCD